jgi:3-isopropylmalate/(R)-2-methylmalate dehydratase large subunit
VLAMTATLAEKIWDAHLVGQRLDGKDLVYLDRHFVHDLHGPEAFRRLAADGRTVRRPDLTIGVLDHTVATVRGRDGTTNPDGADFIAAMRSGTKRFGLRLLDLDDPFQGISHVVAPELGLVLPGFTYACPDSHACTVGGIGALAFACGTSELGHVLATQTIALSRPKSMRIALRGVLPAHVSAKDVALRVLGEIGVAGGTGHIIEFTGSTIESMPIEGRLTLCNLLIEMGARTGLIAPDERTIEWLARREYVPQGELFDQAVSYWRSLASDADARFDRELEFDCTGLEPYVTWGIDPGQSLAISGTVPDPEALEPARRSQVQRALDYMDLKPGAALIGLPIDRVFIGSCTNSRLSDLQAAAEIVAGRRVAPSVTALVVAGSSLVKRQAEALGLDRIFEDAGFTWGEAGCSMCVGINGDVARRGERCVSTTNRNFENRQGVGVRTHLASPETAAAAALYGELVDVSAVVGR